MSIRIRNKKTGKIYSNDMADDLVITDLDFCTSYTQAQVQEKLESGKFEHSEFFLPLENLTHLKPNTMQ